MLFGLDPLSGTALLVLAASSPDKLCVMPGPTKITVTPSAEKVEYDYSKSLDQLQGVQADTVNPHSFSGLTLMQGFTQGAMKMVPKIKLAYKVYPDFGAGCMWYESIDIRLSLDPAITIAREVKQDSCMYRAVLEHEKKHVAVDRKLLNQYSQIIGKKVYDELKSRGFMAGPFRKEDLEAISARMQDTVEQVVAFQWKKLDIDRTEAQQAVDSLKEYQSVQAQCPDFNPLNLKKKRRR
ncbi:MAG: hypothetical protein IT558_05770 [Alphaproteobacteria bacterium]|nr:hypothetical protein [Alphaproteobacteria bacterium]